MNGDVAQRVAGALQADHQPVADELRVARAAQRGHVLDTHGRAGCGEGRGPNNQGDEEAPHPPLTRTEPSERTRPETVTPLSSLRTVTVWPTTPSCKAAPEAVICRPPSM